ncbi:Haloacid dehalogenase-like hydrolase (HAD) superfamily protein [Euphorbia peplus]|nr:Haloacid dehalogenase-like hydrolase (HAD) superfamily protein [Euphorbia peplus]
MEEEVEKVKNEALQMIGEFQNVPGLVVFDLDYTLWPFYCECYDVDDTPYLYPQAKGILYALKENRIHMAIASRSPTPNIAKAFLAKLGLADSFLPQEIFSSWTHKTEHFQRIHKKTGLPFTSMLFFDDEHRNIGPTSEMGVTSILVDDGVNLVALKQGLSEFSQKSSSSSRNINEE